MSQFPFVLLWAALCGNDLFFSSKVKGGYSKVHEGLLDKHGVLVAIGLFVFNGDFLKLGWWDGN